MADGEKSVKTFRIILPSLCEMGPSLPRVARGGIFVRS